MESTLVLYDVEFTADKNYIVDLISDYLQYRPHQKVISNFQLIKLDNFLSIKINLDDEGLDFQNLGYNYVEITNIDNNGDGNGTYYYFIDKVRYESPKTVLLELIFDDLNTFNAMHLLDLTDRTYVKREHRDRFYTSASSTYRLKVDEIDEEIYPPLVNEESYSPVYKNINVLNPEATRLNNLKWYVLYQRYDLNHNIAYIHFIPEEDICIKDVVCTDDDETVRDLIIGGIKNYPTNKDETLRIIELPYCPLKLEYVDTRLIISTNVPTGDSDYACINPVPTGDYPYFKLSDDANYTLRLSAVYRSDGEDTSFVYQTIRPSYTYCAITIVEPNMCSLFDFNDSITILDYNPTPARTITPTDRTLHHKSFESKLYNSNFRKTKYVYDHNEYILKPEHYLDSSVNKLKITFEVNASNVGAFKFDTFYLYKYKDEDLSVILCNRNNEIPLFNDAYLNYMRNGYNFDKTSQTMNLVSNITGGTTQIGASAGLGKPQGVISGITKIINTPMDYMRASEQINKNKQTALQQGISTIGNDDLNTFNAINNNKLNRVDYHLDDEIENQLYNLFRLKGYNTNQYKVPDVESRRNYNYLECIPDFKYIYDSRLINYKNSLISKFNEGVYFIHQCEHDGDMEYDFYMKYENWELWLLPRS